MNETKPTTKTKPLYTTGVIDVPVKLASDYCGVTSCSTFSMCRFPSRPVVVYATTDACAKYVAPI